MLLSRGPVRLSGVVSEAQLRFVTARRRRPRRGATVSISRAEIHTAAAHGLLPPDRTPEDWGGGMRRGDAAQWRCTVLAEAPRRLLLQRGDISVTAG